ncbi:MAG: methionine adenosyltransferase [Methanocalculus sp. MSAO_Arc1]|uniref:methionine adenosyltransferase n=1 Tax=Methanocalculus TaxID=71151 RepID=UPI000FF743B1|nr:MULTISPECIES: methionine adenosyltransferase [unclassified Methanocalculus]MCP1663212.1 S-adenosylmethionine synthetase [Methanocalculus sp. AMF5]RQD80703.1 MAG: methionine adenosyltransferase [Methanocalculus sp. MSAO_Arc1]
MTRNISIASLRQTPIEEQAIELVERKCVGHPDSIADGVAEAISRALCREYDERCDAVLHHNTDQGEVVAGASLPQFGGGRIVKPMYLLLTGRATKSFNGQTIPTDAAAVEAARHYLRETLPTLNMERDIIVDCRMGDGSTDLCDVFRTCGQNQVPRANDTSFGVGHGPFSEVEQIVLAMDQEIATHLRPKNPIIGYDIKIMGLRQGDEMTFTIASAMVDRYCSSIDEYVEATHLMQDHLASVARQYTERKVVVSVNTADDINSNSIFLTVNGTSAEMGDDGSVGRGNRVNGLITPNRPMSMEAASGKNPINHIGKIYNLLSTDIAQEACARVDGITEMYVRLLSRIGQQIDHPLVAGVQIIPEDGADFNSISRDVTEIVNDRLETISTITERVIKGELKTF